jgi:hypothetical protein
MFFVFIINFETYFLSSYDYDKNWLVQNVGQESGEHMAQTAK